MRIVDARGQKCPAPIILTKNALKQAKKGETFKVLTDSATALNNLSRFLTDNKAEFTVNENEADGIWTLSVTKLIDNNVGPMLEGRETLLAN
ncbi:MAG: sulfurtransferase TusA family protein [Bacteroidales bacterium]|nr:sulfurtransferase TusA family protein [Bacteroidales bacterium]